MEPTTSGKSERAFISRGYDATSHFETTARRGRRPTLPRRPAMRPLRQSTCHPMLVLAMSSARVLESKIVAYALRVACQPCHAAQVEDVLDMYTRITGRVLDLSSKDPARAQAQE